MEEIVKQIAEQIPALCVIAWLLWIGGKERESERKHQERREKIEADAKKGETAFRSSMATECHDIKALAIKALQENSKAFGEVTEALRRKKDG